MIRKLLFAADLHGSEIVFKKIFSCAKTNNVDAIIISGDLTGSIVVPIIADGDKYFCKSFGSNINIDGSELNEFKENISNTGAYPIIISQREYEELLKSIQIDKNKLTNLVEIRLSKWVAYAEEISNELNIRVLMMSGNSDPYDIDKIIGKSKIIRNPDYATIELFKLYSIVGESNANKSPFNCLRDIDDEELYKKIKKKVDRIDQKDMGTAIFVFHAPPFNSTLDNAIEVDKNLKPVLMGGHAMTKPAGSRGVRKIIENYQPMLSLHGHMHESSAVAKIGRTLCVNPGSEYSCGIMRALLIYLEKDSVKDYHSISY
jgi:hypothetical protein